MYYVINDAVLNKTQYYIYSIVFLADKNAFSFQIMSHFLI